MQEIRVGLWGFGAMGSGIAKMIASKKGIVITGVCDKWDKIVGKDMYELLDLERGNRPEVRSQLISKFSIPATVILPFWLQIASSRHRWTNWFTALSVALM